jgi:hypothetical protein
MFSAEALFRDILRFKEIMIMLYLASSRSFSSYLLTNIVNNCKTTHPRLFMTLLNVFFMTIKIIWCNLIWYCAVGPFSRLSQESTSFLWWFLSPLSLLTLSQWEETGHPSSKLWLSLPWVTRVTRSDHHASVSISVLLDLHLPLKFVVSTYWDGGTQGLRTALVHT